MHVQRLSFRCNPEGFTHTWLEKWGDSSNIYISTSCNNSIKLHGLLCVSFLFEIPSPWDWPKSFFSIISLSTTLDTSIPDSVFLTHSIKCNLLSISLLIFLEGLSLCSFYLDSKIYSGPQCLMTNIHIIVAIVYMI